jgi:hypothetical protein
MSALGAGEAVGTGDDDLTRLASVNDVSTFFGPKARMAVVASLQREEVLQPE